MIRNYKRYCFLLILFLILLLGVVLRFSNLGSDPAGFFCDEASIGYNAYTIAHYGKDEYGTPFPLFFKAFGEYKSPIEIYSTVPFLKVFGLNEFTTRLPSVIYGVLGIIGIYLLTGEMFAKSKYREILALLSACLLTISPWDIQFSRIAFELMPFVCFTLFGTWAFLRFKKKPYFLFLAILFFSLAFYSYSSARIFIPVFVLLICLFNLKLLISEWQTAFFAFLFGLLLMLPLFFFVMNGDIFARFNQVSIFNQPPHNETVLQHIAFNYYTNLSPDFLFFKGDIGMPGELVTRHSIKGMGELYIWQLPFILLSFVFLIIKQQWQVLSILLIWIILYPTGNMLTTDESAQATRAIIGVVPWQILTATGFIYMFDLIKQKEVKILFVVFCLLITVFSFLQYLQQYFFVYPTYSSNFWGWQYGPKNIIHYFVIHEKKYDGLYMIGEFNAPEIFFKFYAPHDCSNCHIGTPDTNYLPGRKQLFVITPNYLTAHSMYHFKAEKMIYYPNQTIAFEIGEIVQ